MKSFLGFVLLALLVLPASGRDNPVSPQTKRGLLAQKEGTKRNQPLWKRFFNPKKEDARKPTMMVEDLKIADEVLKSYEAPVTSEEVHRAVKQYLQSIQSTCSAKKTTKAERLKVIIDNLNHLRNYAEGTLRERELDVLDRTYLFSISEQIDPREIPYNAKSNASTHEFCKNIRNHFNIYYRFSYKIDPSKSIEDYPHRWATQIAKGLDCICK